MRFMNMIRKSLAFSLSLVLVATSVCFAVPAAFGDDFNDNGTQIDFGSRQAYYNRRVTYAQTDARSMLAMINELRKPGNAWYWDKTDSEKIMPTDLGALTYDYRLEEIAMLRAAELTEKISYYRPDGTLFDTAFDDSYTAYAENIICFGSTAEEAFPIFCSEKSHYSDQPERRRMLSADFTAVGIAHVIYNERDYWVQEFGSPASGAAETPAEDGEKPVRIVTKGENSSSIPEEPTSQEQHEGNYTYKVSDGKAWITGTDGGLAGAVRIPQTLGGYPVVAIGNNAFANCKGITDVTVPEGVEIIGNSAFNGSSLRWIVIPASVKAIGYYAFAECRDMEEIVFLCSPAAIGGEIRDIFSEVYWHLEYMYCYMDRDGWAAYAEYSAVGNSKWGDLNDFPGDGVSISKTSAELKTGETVALSAAISPALAFGLEWSSSDLTVAVVSPDGIVSAVGAGTVTVTAASADGAYSAGCEIRVSGEAPDVSGVSEFPDAEKYVSGPSYGFSGLRGCRQYACDALNGVYFLNYSGEDLDADATLGFYSLRTGTVLPLRTYVGIIDAYRIGSKLYLLFGSGGARVAVFDLDRQSDGELFVLPDIPCVAICADSQGRVLLAGKAKNDASELYVLDAEGTLLAQTSAKTEVFDLFGFDGETGDFWYGAGAALSIGDAFWMQQMLFAGRYADGELRIFDRIEIPMLSESGKARISANAMFGEYPGLTSINQNEHFGCGEVLNGRYLALDSNVYSFLRVIDLDSYDFDTQTTDFGLQISRAAHAEKTGYDLTSVGVRAAYLESGNSILAVAKKDRTIGEYSLENGELVKSFTAAHPVFSLTAVGSVLVLTEREDDVFYIETIDWREAKDSRQEPEDRQPGASGEYVFKTTLPGAWSNNAGGNNYYVWSAPIRSYLIENADRTLTRIENVGSSALIVERFSADGSELLESRTVPEELPLFGGFFAGEDYYYIVSGQANPEEDDSVEVMRIVQYSKSWERLNSASVYGANTTIPFDAGSLRMAEANGRLFIHTCHEMYADINGANHQANMTVILTQADCAVEGCFCKVGENAYVSHSFNQFIAADGETVVTADHGDGFPRGFAVTNCTADGGFDEISSVVFMRFSGGIGLNYTGASLGGLALTEDKLLLAGNTIDRDTEIDSEGQYYAYADESQRNIFVLAADRDHPDFTAAQMTPGFYYSDTLQPQMITDYTEGDKVDVCTPHLVTLGGDRFLLLWEEYPKPEDPNDSFEAPENQIVKAAVVDSDGILRSPIHTFAARLSDCPPIVLSDGSVAWYAGGDGINYINGSSANGTPILYRLNPAFTCRHTHTTEEDGRKICADCGEILVGKPSDHVNASATEPTGPSEPEEPQDGEYLVGDVDFDGKVKATDARLILRSAAKIEQFGDLQLKVADADGDGKVKAGDARLVLRAAAKVQSLSPATIVIAE